MRRCRWGSRGPSQTKINLLLRFEFVLTLTHVAVDKLVKLNIGGAGRDDAEPPLCARHAVAGALGLGADHPLLSLAGGALRRRRRAGPAARDRRAVRRLGAHRLLRPAAVDPAARLGRPRPAGGIFPSRCLWWHLSFPGVVGD